MFFGNTLIAPTKNLTFYFIFEQFVYAMITVEKNIPIKFILSM